MKSTVAWNILHAVDIVLAVAFFANSCVYSLILTAITLSLDISVHSPHAIRVSRSVVKRLKGNEWRQRLDLFPKRFNGRFILPNAIYRMSRFVLLLWCWTNTNVLADYYLSAWAFLPVWTVRSPTPGFWLHSAWSSKRDFCLNTRAFPTFSPDVTPGTKRF